MPAWSKPAADSPPEISKQSLGTPRSGVGAPDITELPQAATAAPCSRLLRDKSQLMKLE
jgi:hypothetical protein